MCISRDLLCILYFSHLGKSKKTSAKFFLLGQTWSVFPLQNGQYKQENTRGLPF